MPKGLAIGLRGTASIEYSDEGVTFRLKNGEAKFTILINIWNKILSNFNKNWNSKSKKMYLNCKVNKIVKFI